MPTFRVRLFAAHREAVGRSVVTVDLPDSARVGDVRDGLVRRYPALGAAGASTVIAVNGQFAPDDRPIRRGDDLAAFPPVAGG